MTDFPDLLILRHGETEWNLAGRMQGDLDSRLTARGRAQAAAQGRILARLGAAAMDWIASPKGRTVETARIAGQGAAFRTDPRLREIGMGRWTGRLRDEIAAEAPHLFAAGVPELEMYRHIPEGEALDAVAARAADFLAGLERPTVIVTHGITSRLLRCHVLGMPVDLFDRLDGGQGVVYRVAGGGCEKLTDDSAS